MSPEVRATQHADLAKLDVIMVTYNQPGYVGQAMKSLLATWAWYPFRLIVVNNGDPEGVPPVAPDSQAQVQIIQQPFNSGWEGGLKAGLAVSDAPFVVFSNDDIQIPHASRHWARMLLNPFRDPRIAAVGPTSNFIAGLQNISQQPSFQYFPAAYLIGFFMAVRRAALDQVGGIDCTLPGGDDIDLSIRLRKAGYSLMVRNDLFIFHHGEITGKAVHGDDWNSRDHSERTFNALIARHGVVEWFNTLWEQNGASVQAMYDVSKPETAAVAEWTPQGRVLEMGCGNKLTVPWAIGVDQFREGAWTPWRFQSVAQVVADIFAPMPQFEDASADGIIGRHVLEHCVDILGVLREWARILKPGGRLIVAAPNEEIVDGVPMDPTHLHGLTPKSMRHFAEAVGLRCLAETPDCGNALSFVAAYEKPA